ncbi:MSH6 family protein [Megaselia abdita]
MSKKTPVSNKKVNNLFKYFSPTAASKKPSDENGNVAKSLKQCFSPSPSKKVKLEEKTNKKESPKDKEVPKSSKKEKRQPEDSDHSEKENDDEEVVEGKRPRKKRRRIIVESESEGDDFSGDSEPEYKPDAKEEEEEEEESEDEVEESPNVSKEMEVDDEETEKPPTKKMSKTTTNLYSLALKAGDNADEENPPDTKDLDEDVVHTHKTLKFLEPDVIKDKKGRKRTDPDYDPSTLFVPEKFLNDLTPGMRQWWELKSNNNDSVLFFKVGKFYELYHWDADIGVQELGFAYMRGDFAHSGFPEAAFDKMASILIEKGYKVARVEQTETPDMMTARCKKMAKTTKFDKVVKREICQISNKGTQIFDGQRQMLEDHEPNYMMTLVESVNDDDPSTSSYGVSFIDTSIGDFYIGQFRDDKSSSRILTLLSHYSPVLVLYEKASISERSQQIFKSALCNVIKENIPGNQFWDGSKALKYLAENFYTHSEESDKEKWPEMLKVMQDEGDHLGLTPKKSFSLALKSLGGTLSYAVRCKLAEKIMNMAQFQLYIPPDKNVSEDKDISKILETTKDKIDTLHLKKKNMVLDSVTLLNLKIIEGDDSLLKTIDMCCTKFGKRLIHHWVCSPSTDVKVIRQRQEAIKELIEEPEILQETRAFLATLPDFERGLAQINVFGNPLISKGHPDSRAILFEEKKFNKNKIQHFIAMIKGFESLLNLSTSFCSFKSPLIKRITKDSFPDLTEVLNFFKTAFDPVEAEKEGTIAPKKGVDEEYDSTEREIEKINKELFEYLKEQEKYFGCKISYFGTEKKRYQLEVPEKCIGKAGKQYVLESQKKGAKRYATAETKEFLRRMMQAEDNRAKVLKDLSRRIYEKFSINYNLWKQATDCVSILDILCGLAEYARNLNVFCLPEFVEDAEKPFIQLEEGFHPCYNDDDFIPNGLSLGGDIAPLSILTGPNMGGKSTLMREVGLIVVLAHIGSYVPAESCKLSVVDRIFTRLGAQDDLLAGHSTFMVELSETSVILKHATENSLVLLDELGRGTATYDGTSIAVAVVNFLADLQCRCLFSTHYHNLVDYFNGDKRVCLGHMACMVENDESDNPTKETVTFLYKYSSGSCPKSYGFNAARLAGMPNGIIDRAYKVWVFCRIFFYHIKNVLHSSSRNTWKVSV